MKVVRPSLLRVIAPHFVAGAVLFRGKVVRSAPILHYLRGWSYEQVWHYVLGKGWSLSRRNF